MSDKKRKMTHRHTTGYKTQQRKTNDQATWKQQKTRDDLGYFY